MRLKNKIAIVTGAGSGIGEMISRVFAREGAVVAVTDVNLAAAERVAAEISAEFQTKTRAYALDVADQNTVESVVCAVEEELGPIDVLVNNAGISKTIPFLNCSEELWERILTINLTGTFFCCQSVIKRMLPRQSGVIINMSSSSGKEGSSCMAAYCASKFGVMGLSQSLAVEYAKSGIRVNSICPGIVFTPLWDEMDKDYAAKRNLKVEEVRPYLESKIPMGRAATTEEVAYAALFLASDEASYITGQSINLTGGTLMQ